jgi:hypothetical protein
MRDFMMKNSSFFQQLKMQKKPLSGLHREPLSLTLLPHHVGTLTRDTSTCLTLDRKEIDCEDWIVKFLQASGKECAFDEKRLIVRFAAEVDHQSVEINTLAVENNKHDLAVSRHAGLSMTYGNTRSLIQNECRKVTMHRGSFSKENFKRDQMRVQLLVRPKYVVQDGMLKVTLVCPLIYQEPMNLSQEIDRLFSFSQ